MSITERYDYKAMTAIEPYPADAALLKRLSIAPFGKIPADKKHFVGTAHAGQCEVDIFVTGPIPYWEFNIVNPETKQTTVIKTQTGPLHSFWSKVAAIADSISKNELAITSVPMACV